jgi:hypothetical protein
MSGVVLLVAGVDGGLRGWDLQVDHGQKKKVVSDKLKIAGPKDAAPAEDDLPTLDASFVDVYKGAHGVIFVYDMTKAWSFEYIQRELPKVPKSMPVLIIGNFRDRGDHRTVTSDEVTYWMRSLDRCEDPEASKMLYAEASLANGFGLMCGGSLLLRAVLLCAGALFSGCCAVAPSLRAVFVFAGSLLGGDVRWLPCSVLFLFVRGLSSRV